MSEFTGREKSVEYNFRPSDILIIRTRHSMIFDFDNCILFIWCVDPLLDKAFDVIKSWNFTFKTMGFVWVKITKQNKPKMGLGYWTRGSTEYCLLATKGKPKRINKSISKTIIERPREHSRKPDIIRNKIVELCGDLPRIELFAREKTNGWDCWGNEL